MLYGRSMDALLKSPFTHYRPSGAIPSPCTRVRPPGMGCIQWPTAQRCIGDPRCGWENGVNYVDLWVTPVIYGHMYKTCRIAQSSMLTEWECQLRSSNVLAFTRMSEGSPREAVYLISRSPVQIFSSLFDIAPYGQATRKA